MRKTDLIAIILFHLVSLGFSFGLKANEVISFECYREVEGRELGGLYKIKVPLHPGLFSHDGSGPNGAHWNLRENLFCIGLIPYALEEIKAVKVKVGRQGIYDISQETMGGSRKGVVIFPIPSSVYLGRKGTRQIKKSDLEKLYHDRPREIREYLRSGRWDYVAPPEVGRVIEVKLSLTRKNGDRSEAVGLIHVAYGE